MEKKMESTTIEDESSMMTTTIVKGRAKGAGGGKIRHRNILRTQKQIKEFFNFISNIHTHTNTVQRDLFFIRTEYFSPRACFRFRVRATAIDLKQQYMIDYNMPCEVFYERQFDVSALRLSGIVRQFV